MIATYFINAVAEYTTLSHENGSTRENDKGMVYFRPKAFRQSPLPLFLEGVVHYLRTLPGKSQAAEVAARVRQSGLYDRKLQMYKVNASLEEQPMEIGRARAFTPGWFENESIWLHMEYKYMLEILRNGLFEEFYRDFKNVFVPFFDPAVYGRSILENASFIVSSANPDRSLHGNGFVARLSGATAEFINILLLMTVGPTPFHINRAGELQLEFRPALPSWLFTEEDRSERLYRNGSWHDVTFAKNSFSFMFLGETLVTYLNPQRQNTFGVEAVFPQSWRLFDHAGEEVVITGSVLKGVWAEKIRRREVKRIEIQLS
jgi:hypothetical protein